MKHGVFFSRPWKSIFMLTLLFLIYHVAIRPWMLDWGAPKKIQDLNLSGDHLTNGTGHTRAILIHSTPEEIWPWILQLGQERGGFYSYTWLENIFQADMQNVYEIRNTLQRPRMQGDTIWLASKQNYNGQAFQMVAEITPAKSFVMVGGDDFDRIKAGRKGVGSWSIYLYPENAESTWLIVRSSGDEPMVTQVVRYFTFEIPHFIMEQKMLRGIKELAEK